jgi:hypothetical protein
MGCGHVLRARAGPSVRVCGEYTDPKLSARDVYVIATEAFSRRDALGPSTCPRCHIQLGSTAALHRHLTGKAHQDDDAPPCPLARVACVVCGMHGERAFIEGQHFRTHPSGAAKAAKAQDLLAWAGAKREKARDRVRTLAMQKETLERQMHALKIQMHTLEREMQAAHKNEVHWEKKLQDADRLVRKSWA